MNKEIKDSAAMLGLTTLLTGGLIEIMGEKIREKEYDINKLKEKLENKEEKIEEIEKQVEKYEKEMEGLQSLIKKFTESEKKGKKPKVKKDERTKSRSK